MITVALKVNTSDIVNNLNIKTRTTFKCKQGKVLQDNQRTLNKALTLSVNDIQKPLKDLIDTTVGNIEDILDSILGV